MADFSEDKSRKKLLVLAGAGPHAKVVESAKEMGLYTVVADYLPESVYSPAKLIADESLMINIYDVDGLTEYCRKNEIDGVINFCIDPAQKPCQQLADNLGLPAFGTSEQVTVLTDKIKFKKICRETGVDVIDEFTESDVKNGTVKYPVIVKPNDSRGSRGATVCWNGKEVENALFTAKSESSNGEILIEKYFSGGVQDLTISYIVKNGEPVLVSIGDRYSGSEKDNLQRQLICTIQPSRYAHMYMQHVNERVINMIKHIGIQNGLVFMQGFADGNTVRMYDPGLRFPGNEYERIYRKATGIDLMKSAISYVIGGEIDDYGGRINGSYDLNGMAAIQYMINVGEGQIAVFDGLERIKKHPAVIDIQQRHFIGDKIENTGDIRHRAGEISVLVERKPELMSEAIQFIQENLKIEDENGNNMIISPIDANEVYRIYSDGYGEVWDE